MWKCVLEESELDLGMYTKPDAFQKDCLFQVYQISPTVVALKCLADDMFLRRLSTDNMESALHASYPSYDDKI